jgi:hypothetical protein
MTEKEIDFAYPWSKQPNALRNNLIDMVFMTSIHPMTSRFNLNTLSLAVQNTSLLLPQLAKLSSTIDVERTPTKKTKKPKSSVLVNVAIHLSSPVPTNGNVVPQAHPLMQIEFCWY